MSSPMAFGRCTDYQDIRTFFECSPPCRSKISLRWGRYLFNEPSLHLHWEERPSLLEWPATLWVYIIVLILLLEDMWAIPYLFFILISHISQAVSPNSSSSQSSLLGPKAWSGCTKMQSENNKSRYSIHKEALTAAVVGVHKPLSCQRT